MQLHSGVAGSCGNTAVVLLIAGHHDVALHPPFSTPTAEEEGKSTQAMEAGWRRDAMKVQMWFDGELREFDYSFLEAWWRIDRSLMKV